MSSYDVLWVLFLWNTFNLLSSILVNFVIIIIIIIIIIILKITLNPKKIFLCTEQENSGCFLLYKQRCRV